jgi:hypothetical protein
MDYMNLELITLRAGVKVPSTSNNTIVSGCSRSCQSDIIKQANIVKG